MTLANLLAALALASAAGAAGTHPASCKPRPGQVLARKGSEVIFRRSTGPSGEYGAASALYGCQRTRQRPVRLLAFQEGMDPEVQRLAGVDAVFAGAYAALTYKIYDAACAKYTGGGPECESSGLASFDLRTGKTRAHAPEAASALVLSARGWVGWVSAQGGALHAIGSKGARVLDPGPVEPASLKLSGQTLRWTSTASTHSALLE